MSGLETAIRTALENSDRDNPEVRARIYQSARQALEAGLRKQDITDTEVVAHHRHRLESTIHAIEGEERDRLHPRQRPPEVPVPPVVEMPAPPVHQAQVDEFDGPMVSGETRAPNVAPNRGDESSLDDVHAGSADHLAAAPVGEERLARGQRATNMDFRPERAAGRRKPRKFFETARLVRAAGLHRHRRLVGAYIGPADDGGRTRHQRRQSAGKHPARGFYRQ